MTTLREACLGVIALDPHKGLSKGEMDPGEELARSKSPLMWQQKTPFIACAPGVSETGNWKDVWTDVRLAGDVAARRGEARPQIASALAARGRLMDGSLPSDFWDDLRCDALSLASSRVGPSVLNALGGAQSNQGIGRTLVALDLGSCLLVDDDGVKIVAEACGATLERLGLRDCRKLTDAVFDCLVELPKLIDVDVGGDINITPDGIRKKFFLNREGPQTKRAKTSKAPPPNLAALGVSGLGIDAEFLSAAGNVLGADLVRLGVGYARAPSRSFQAALPAWPNLTDLRVQWTTTFDDAALDVLATHCSRITAVDVVGTPVTADALRSLLLLRASPLPEDLPSAAEGDLRFLSWLSCRYTAGPKLALQKLATEYTDAPNLGVTVLLK